MKTSELTGAALDWAVAKCEGMENKSGMWTDNKWLGIPFSTNWAHGGPIIERERLWVGYSAVGQSLRLVVMEDAVVQCHKRLHPPRPCSTTGPTILIAAMRCYVFGKLGNDIELPEGLK